MTTKVTIDGRAIRQQLNADVDAQRHLERVADALALVAAMSSPVGNPKNSKMPGYFRRRWYVRRFRSVYFVGNSDAFYHLIEYGSMNNPTYAPTRKAMHNVAAAIPGVKAVFYSKGAGASRDLDG